MPSSGWPKISGEIGYEEKTGRQMLAESEFLLMPFGLDANGPMQIYVQRVGSLLCFNLTAA